MAEERVEPREINFRQLCPWTELFRGFQVALDPKKLLLAAGGILVMAAGWWLLGLLFFDARFDPHNKPTEANFDINRYQQEGISPEEAEKERQRDVKTAQDRWELLHETSNQTDGKLRTWPWAEGRGANPYLLVTDLLVTGKAAVPAQGWLKQFLVLIEPLVKLFRPVIYLFDSRGGFLERLYFVLVIVWTLATWALFGGAITRMASVQLARNEKIGMTEALRFVWSRYMYYFTAPLFPLLLVAFIVFCLAAFGLIGSIPYAGDFWDGVLWPLALLGGLGVAVVLVGLVGWPMMYATISAEGSDSFDAISRSYSYVYQSPWNYIWYSLVALAYGAVVVFFVGFMGSLIVYLGKWGVSTGVFAKSREPSYLFVYAPESFHWRELLLQGGTVEGESLVVDGQINESAYNKYLGYQPAADGSGNLEPYEGLDTMTVVNKIGAGLVSVWLYLFFLMILGFGYSYFWTASTIIYLLMRRKVDDTDLDEVYLEEDETEDTYAPTAPAPAPAPASAPAAGGGVPLQMVEPPALRTPPTPAPTSASPASKEGDGDKPTA